MSWITEPVLRGRTRPFLWLLVSITASGTLALHILVPALPQAARDLGVSNGAIQLTITLYLVGLASGQLLYGPVSDRFGRRPVLLAALLLYVLGSMAACLASTAPVLIAARVIQALGGCGGLVLGRAMVRDMAGPEEAAAQLALLNLVVSIAPALSPVVGGYLTVFAGWRAIFALLTAIGAATLLLTMLTVPETTRLRQASGAMHMLRSYALLLRSPIFCGYALGGACMTTSFYAFTSESPFIFMDQLHRPTQEMGLYYLLLFSGISLGSLIANRLARRVAMPRLLRSACLLATVGAALFLLVAVTGRLSVVSVVGSVVLFTIAAGTASPLALTGSVSVHPGAIGAAAGLYGFTQMAFGAVCTLAVSAWHGDPSLAAATVLLVSTLIGQGAVMVATRRSSSGSPT